MPLRLNCRAIDRESNLLGGLGQGGRHVMVPQLYYLPAFAADQKLDRMGMGLLARIGGASRDAANERR
jgi:hypothetical protein